MGIGARFNLKSAQNRFSFSGLSDCHILHFMYIFKPVNQLQQHLAQLRTAGHRIGLVPTMGALHKGHLTLLSTALESCDQVVCSIFVNPTQFNDASDLDRYPRPIERDIAQLEAVGCSVLFLPPVAEVYPDGWAPPTIDLGGLDHTM